MSNKECTTDDRKASPSLVNSALPRSVQRIYPPLDIGHSLLAVGHSIQGKRGPSSAAARATAGVRGGRDYNLASIAWHTVLRTLIRAWSLQLDSMTVQGAWGVPVRKSISSTAASYSPHFSRLRQSSSVIFHRL